jgi:hypothetical protein
MSRTTVEDCQKISIQNLNKLGYGIELDINGIKIGLTTSKCNYGGCRYWFICPSCKRRVGVLYRKPLNKLFLCRKCNNLTYQLTKFRRSGIEGHLKAISKFKKSGYCISAPFSHPK